MGWSYPDISLEDLMKLVKAFVDVLILASGYQSTGRHAHWDSHNIKKAFQWAILLQNVFKGLTRLDDHEDSIKEVDAALSELKSSQHFPQGLAHLSSATLSRAMDLILKRLIHTLPLRESNLRAIITAVIEMDFDELQRIDNNCLHVYLERLTRDASINSNLSRPNFLLDDLTFSSPEAAPSGKHENWIDGGFSRCALQEFETRQHAVSSISAVQTGLDILLKTIGQSLCNEPGSIPYGERMHHQTSLITEEPPVESVVWNHWRSRNLSYMLDRRTMRLVSGASLIFSDPKGQWVQILERLNVSAENDDNLFETIELLLLGCITDKWSSLIDHLMSSSCESLTMSKLYHDVHNLSLGRSHELCCNVGLMNSKEKSVLDYLEVFLSSQLNQLWKLSPIVAAVALPCWSQLFKSYLSKLQSQFRGDSSTIRCCSCSTDGKEHRECEVAERIWCIYIIHVGRSHRTCSTNSI
ncbi:hypothetical protein Adt_01672 [Abeliophyllum distichum]|uniref:Uncharacterized protein n=1 Tax=Abeliophyllum distichum TaxID=126358 RepID=A0ABD1VTJ4_9LAMI